MKVLHLLSGDLTGGAARGALWLHNAQLSMGLKSEIIIDSNHNSNQSEIHTNTRNLEKLSRLVRSKIDRIPNQLLNKNNISYSYNLVGRDILNNPIYQNADIIHLHWINNGFLSLHQINKMKKPIVWTLRDMWPLTGGCHYTMSCVQYKTGCGNCPLLKGNFHYDASYFLSIYKQNIVRKNNITAVGISSWISQCAKDSFIFKDSRIETIGNTIDVEKFQPLNKKIAKEILKIKNKKIISFGAQYINDNYKGMNELLKSLEIISRRNDIHLFIFGNISNDIIQTINIPYTYFGFVRDDLSLNLIYSASDVFVAPSKMEAFGKTIAESMSCGTPVVAFNFSGPQDIIDHQQSGYLAKPYCEFDLACGMNYILNLNEIEYNSMAHSARKKIIDTFSPKIIAKKYSKLYHDILKNASNNN